MAHRKPKMNRWSWGIVIILLLLILFIFYSAYQNEYAAEHDTDEAGTPIPVPNPRQ